MEDNDDDPGRFRACSEEELARSPTGAEVFAALKGAVDVGLDDPHSGKRFPGYDSEAKSLKADGYRAHIFRQHIADYMRNLSEEDEDAYKKEFSKHIKLGTIPYSIEGMYTKAHAASRTDPSAKAEGDKKVTKKRRTAAKIGRKTRKAYVAAAKPPERNVIKFLKKPATRFQRQAQVQTRVQICKTDIHRYCEKISNIFPFIVVEQYCHSEPEKKCELEMKT